MGVPKASTWNACLLCDIMCQLHLSSAIQIGTLSPCMWISHAIICQWKSFLKKVQGEKELLPETDQHGSSYRRPYFWTVLQGKSVLTHTFPQPNLHQRKGFHTCCNKNLGACAWVLPQLSLIKTVRTTILLVGLAFSAPFYFSLGVIKVHWQRQWSLHKALWEQYRTVKTPFLYGSVWNDHQGRSLMLLSPSSMAAFITFNFEIATENYQPDEEGEIKMKAILYQTQRYCCRLCL